jgi:glucose-6-phosphate isomerase
MHHAIKRLRDLQAIFLDQTAFSEMNPDATVYLVQWYEPVSQDTQGGLFWGVTTIEPGQVGNQYFMTRGHFHSNRNRAEYYCTVQGEGLLLLMDEEGSTRTEPMSPGTLHYIPGHTAHRVVNTGTTQFKFWACWPSDAGYDYEAISAKPFGLRVIEHNGSPSIVLAETIPSIQDAE